MTYQTNKFNLMFHDFMVNMPKIIRNIVNAAFVILLLLCFTFTCYASENTYVEVTLPQYDVRFNDVDIDSSNREYPVIVYNDMAYFPMTYYDSRFMGIETKWDPKSGFVITKAGVPQAYHDYVGTENPDVLSARVLTGNIAVNGKIIDNSEENYPVLTFRNVPYFPMTERFCLEEFDWEYSFSEEDGLSISEKSRFYQSETAVSSTFILPNMKKDDGTGVAFTMADNHFYYEGENGEIYCAPVSEPSDAKVIYQLPEVKGSEKNDPDVDPEDRYYIKPLLKTVKKKAVLSYVETQNGKSRTRCFILSENDARKTFRRFRNTETDRIRSNGHVYYVDDLGQLCKKGEPESLNPGGIVEKMEVQEGYILVTFSPDSANEYRTFVIGKSGDIIYRSTEETANVVIYDGKLMFIKEQL